jgi:hypothetical protein
MVNTRPLQLHLTKNPRPRRVLLRSLHICPAGLEIHPLDSSTCSFAGPLFFFVSSNIGTLDPFPRGSPPSAFVEQKLDPWLRHWCPFSYQIVPTRITHRGAAAIQLHDLHDSFPKPFPPSCEHSVADLIVNRWVFSPQFRIASRNE